MEKKEKKSEYSEIIKEVRRLIELEEEKEVLWRWLWVGFIVGMINRILFL